MKKLSLVLALVLLASCIFGVSAIADDGVKTATYKDVTITYSNVSYVDEMALMFAVPVPADLPEDAKVSVVVWKDYENTAAFSYSDVESATSSAVELSPEAQTVTIGGVEHYVYKYYGLTAAMMTDVVYARSVVVDGDSRYYGDIISKSVVEYVKTALGEFEGYAGLADENAKNVLKSLLSFGAMAQIYLGDDGDIYAPSGYLANEDLQKIWITPVIGGVEQEKVFGGFFKADADAYATLYPEFYDFYTIGSWLDSAGNALVDADGIVDNGFQVAAPAEGDLVIKCEYSKKMVLDSKIEDAPLKKYDVDHVGTTIFTQTAAGRRIEMVEASLAGNTGSGPAQEKNNFTSFTVINDPINPESGDKVLRWTGVENSALYFTPKNTQIQIRDKVSGIGDTIDPVFTIDVTIAKYMEGPASSAHFRIRSDYLKAATGTGTGQCNLNVFKLDKGVVKLNVSDSTYVDLCELSKDSYTRFAITIDFAAETVKGYVMDENGEFQLVVAETVRERPGALAIGAAVVDESGNPRNVGYDSLYSWLMNAQKKIEWYGGNVAGGITNNALGTLTVDLDGDGVNETKITEDGTLKTINQEAYAMWFEQNRSILVKDVQMYAGGVD